MPKVFKPNPRITVYDDVFCWKSHYYINEMCTTSAYSIGWADRVEVKEKNLHRLIPNKYWPKYNTNKTNNMTVSALSMMNNTFEKLVDDWDQDDLEQAIINCDTMASSHYKHAHLNENVLLYYANLKWEDGWGGETIFYDDNGKDIIYTSPYIPNRLIRFDGHLIHTFNPPSRVADKYRFTISTFYKRQHKTV